VCVCVCMCVCVDRHFGTSIADLRLHLAVTDSGLASSQYGWRQR
jgi:hypothetical protein